MLIIFSLFVGCQSYSNHPIKEIDPLKFKKEQGVYKVDDGQTIDAESAVKSRNLTEKEIAKLAADKARSEAIQAKRQSEIRYSNLIIQEKDQQIKLQQKKNEKMLFFTVVLTFLHFCFVFLLIKMGIVKKLIGN